MSKRKKTSKETFLDDAEKIMRQYADQDKNLIVWRGKYPHKGIDNTYERDTVIVGISDDKKSDKAPTIHLLMVHLDLLAKIKFDDGLGKHISESCPFGGGWIPIKEVEKFAKRLPEIFR